MAIDPASVRPMLATTADAPLNSAEFVYEPKYDGIRAIAIVEPKGQVRLWSRLGNEKTAAFPGVADALQAWARRLDRPVVLDGEVVALDARGNPIGFQNLQRVQMHDVPIAFVAFDLLRDGSEDLRGRPLHHRRTRLESLIDGVADPRFRISEQAVGDGRAMQARAEAERWEGLIAKRVDSPYRSGKRSPDWRKLKLVRRQTCVVGGWTDPRGSRPFFGALLLGVHDEAGRLLYVGHSGAGFTDAELGRVWKRLRALETKTCPFAAVPRTNERPHWVQPTLVAEVKFTEWTADDKLRHPTYIGLRDDQDPARVKREPDTLAGSASRNPAYLSRANGGQVPSPSTRSVVGRVPRPSTRSERPARVKGRRGPATPNRSTIATLLQQVDEIEHGRGNGTLELPGGERLEVSNLGKMFWPALKLTKGDLFRHYIRVAPYILPVLADRPLVMKRYPNGVNGKPFYQHRAPDRRPSGVRVETVETSTESRAHLVGGSLLTLLYTVQLASISQDPWFSRVGSAETIDHVAIDLDPPEGLPFRRVLDVASWVRDALDGIKAPGFPKTSGSGGLHIYIPMPPDTPYAAGQLFAQIVATTVAARHPKFATVERSLKARGQRVYVDFMQNSLGKTLASAYSARANDFGGVSTPLTWKEVDAGVKPQDFTVKDFAARLEAVGDLWAALRRSKPADLRAVERLGKG
jgi:bifunctional non-homologous end joining protein LigD